MTTGGTICPYCHTQIAAGSAHLCPIITTAEGIQVGGWQRQHEVVDLVRSLDEATKRIAMLEAENERWQCLFEDWTSTQWRLEHEKDELDAKLAEANELIAVQQHGLAECFKALDDNATNGVVLEAQRAELLSEALGEALGRYTESQHELAVYKQALRLACGSGRVLELRPSPQSWRELSHSERIEHFLELARRELSDD